jgi:ubiquinone/menaquinone biosynthesis C-methylase UbiE
MPEAYERWLAPTVFHPFAVDLARRALSHAPKRVLELAAGTGVLTRELVGGLPQADVTATDLNPAMVDFGRQATSGATWRQADALDLPFQAGEFDLIACQFGVMFFPDKAGAFAEIRRVLTADGRLLMSTWGPVSTHGFAAALMAGVERAFPATRPRSWPRSRTGIPTSAR